MYSTYLDADIDLTAQQITSNGEDVNIIPHSELERFLTSSKRAMEMDVKVHYTQITTNEPRHYVFLCAISDNAGRRVEAIGEALDATLETQIAQNYPTLMAFKRAFDAAAILYLGLEGKIYSDQQCSADDLSSGNTYGSEPMDVDEDAAPEWAEKSPTKGFKASPKTTTSESSGKKSGAKSSFGGEPMDGDEDEPGDSDAPPAPASTKRETKKENATRTKDARKAANEAKKAAAAGTFAAPPLEEGDETYEEETPTEEVPSNAFGAPPDNDEEDGADGEESPTTDDGEPDIYDTTIISIGRLQSKPMSIRQAYNDRIGRDTFDWIIDTMTAYSEQSKQLQQLCIEFRKLMGGAEDGD